MNTLFLGFVGLVLIPALILSLLLNRWVKRSVDHETNDDHMKFTMSPDAN